MPNYVCGVDPGTHNLAVAVVDADTKEIVYLHKENLFQSFVQGKGFVDWEFEQKLVPYFLEKYITTNESIFSKCSLFCVEHQIMERMHRVGFGVEALCSRYGRATTVHPSTVKAWAGTRKGVYVENKRAAVAWCNNNLEGINLARFREFERSGVKTDDVADAVMLALYGITKYADLHSVALKEKGSVPKKKRRKKRVKSVDSIN